MLTPHCYVKRESISEGGNWRQFRSYSSGGRHNRNFSVSRSGNHYEARNMSEHQPRWRRFSC
jgi:hypothetical protein